VSLGVLSLSFASEKAGTSTIDHIIITLKLNGVSDADILGVKESMNELVNDGKSLKEAGSIVFEAIDQAMAEGLEGAALAAKVTGLVAQRKQESLVLKETKE
jgi:hypothetical protein